MTDAAATATGNEAQPTTTPTSGLSAALTSEGSLANAAPATPATSAQEKAWYDDSIKDAQLKEWVGKKGWKDVENLAKSAYNLERMKGMSEERVVIKPSDPKNESEVAEYYNKLGRPETPDGYVDKDSNVDKSFLETAHKLGITKDQFGELVKYDEARMKGMMETAEKQFAERAASDIADLKREWGNRYGELEQVAKRAVQKFGMGEELHKIERALGTKAMMQMLHKMGQITGEAVLHDEAHPSSTHKSFGVSPSQAKAEFDSWSSDPAKIARITNSDQGVRKAAIEERSRWARMMGG